MSKSRTGKDFEAELDTKKTITRADIEGKFRELRVEVDDTADTAKSYALAVGAGVVTIVFIVAFVAGRSRGKKKSTVVEIRRI